MTRLAWDQTSEKRYEIGVDRGVLYPTGDPGVPWNGLISVTENVSGGESGQYYYDGVKYMDTVGSEDFQATVEAFTFPDEFRQFDGLQRVVQGLYATQQPRKTFGLCYRTLLGDDVEGTERGYLLHLIYNAVALPTAKQNQTMGADISPVNFQWTINCRPESIDQLLPPGVGSFKPSAHLVVNSTEVAPGDLDNLEDYLYGTPSSAPALPPQYDVIDMLATGS